MDSWAFELGDDTSAVCAPASRPQKSLGGWVVLQQTLNGGAWIPRGAKLLGRQKSWVCRRLALIERFGSQGQGRSTGGLLSPTAARQIVRLPEGNHTEVLESIRRETLTTAEMAGVVDLWFGCAAEQRQQEYLLRHPREALSQAKGTLPTAHDPRLSEDGNRVWKRVGLQLDALGRMEVWLAHHGHTGLTAQDRTILAPRFQRPGTRRRIGSGPEPGLRQQTAG